MHYGLHYRKEILQNENTRNVERRKFKCNRYRWTLSTSSIELLGKRESLIGSSVKKFWAKFRTREPLRDNWPLINGRGAIEFPATFSLRVHKSKRYDFVVSHPKIKLFSEEDEVLLGWSPLHISFPLPPINIRELILQKYHRIVK